MGLDQAFKENKGSFLEKWLFEYFSKLNHEIIENSL